ncbi:MAG: HAMP domain-containing protein [Candidatus Omnitrophica bacterium]|nr:HAMP domain-containing protein [Candidatus Omnitrophota bacterium]
MSKEKDKTMTPPQLAKDKKKNFRISIRFKLAFPVLIFAVLMLFVLFRTTFRTVSTLVLDRTEGRLKAVAEVFAETVKVPLILDNQQVLLANIEWMAKRPDVIEVRVEDAKGVIVGGEKPTNLTLPDNVVESKFIGVKRVGQDIYGVAVPIQAHDRQIGRVMVLFNQQGFEAQLKNIFEERFLLSLLLSLVLAILAASVTWLSIRPLLGLQKTTQEILAGDLSARANIQSFDEIQDLAEAFNEMVARLGKSMDSLRARTEALEESEAKYRVFVENASDIIFTLTPEGQLVLLNKDMSGWPRVEILARGLSLILEMHAEDSRQKFMDFMNQVKDQKQEFTNIPLKHIHHGNQSEIFYLTNMSPVLDHDNNVKWIQAVMRDVTELRRIEIMKESLVRDVAHELKTPTAKFEMAVTWFEKELDRNHEAAKYAPVIDILKKNVDRLMRTITSIMDLSKLESGMSQLTAVNLDLTEVLEQVCQDMEPICAQKKLKLVRHFSKETLSMTGDHDMLYRLFVNLISNANKFTEAGSITVQSQIAEKSILVLVTDTGPGIESAMIEKIFERFVQKTAASPGIGVGLTISRDIAALHHGRIWAESEGLGKGASFKVEFPLRNQ